MIIFNHSSSRTWQSEWNFSFVLSISCSVQDLFWSDCLVQSISQIIFSSEFNIRACQRSYRWCRSSFSSSSLSVLSQQCSLKTRFVISLKKTDLEFKKKDFQLLVLLALVFVFKRTRMILKRSANSVMSWLNQSCDMTREVIKTHTFLLLRMLLAEEKRDVCTFWM